MVRDLKSKDKDEFVKMQMEFSKSPACAQSLNKETCENNFENAQKGDQNCRLVFLEREGELAGYIFISFSYSTSVGGRIIWLEELYVKSSFRGGAGKELLSWLFNEYKNDIKHIRLEVTEDNKGAKRLYKNIGFDYIEYKQMGADVEDIKC